MRRRHGSTRCSQRRHSTLGQIARRMIGIRIYSVERSVPHPESQVRGRGDWVLPGAPWIDSRRPRAARIAAMNSTSHAIRIHTTGGPEVLQWEPVDVSSPGPGEAVVSQTAIGLNFIDVYHRTGLYPVPAMPAIIGSEAAGVVEAVGEGVSEVEVGDRVAYCMSIGSYTQRRAIASRLRRLPGQKRILGIRVRLELQKGFVPRPRGAAWRCRQRRRPPRAHRPRADDSTRPCHTQPGNEAPCRTSARFVGGPVLDAALCLVLAQVFAEGTLGGRTVWCWVFAT